MIIFIEGPDHPGKSALYGCVASAMKNDAKKHNLYFYDAREADVCGPKTAFRRAGAKVDMALDLNYAYPAANFIICGGPLSLLVEAFDLDDMELVREASDRFGRCQYQRVALVSILSGPDDKEGRESYRYMSSKYMTVIADAGKRNSYRVFQYGGGEDSVNLFNSDVLTLINN